MNIIDMHPGNDNVEFTAVISRVTIGKTNGANKSDYLNLTLGDKSGEIDAKLWAATKKDIADFTQGALVAGKGDIIKYNGSRQMKVVKLTKLDASDEEKLNYIPSAPIDAAFMMILIDHTIDNVKDRTYQAITRALIDENRDSYMYAPAASRNHHEYVSGLLYHTYTMLRIGLDLCDIYDSLDKDLLSCGIILHDIGKIKELSGPVNRAYTLEGNLLGHISIGAEMIAQKARELGYSGEKVTLLEHMVLAHHGKHEYGSPVLPMVKEAEILFLIDNIDARMNMFDKALSEIEEGEYTKRIFALDNRNIYKPKK